MTASRPSEICLDPEWVALEHVAADAGEDDPLETIRMGDGGPQQGQCAEREPHRVDRLGRECRHDAFGQVGVGVGLVGFRRIAVSEEIDTDHLLAAVLEQCGEAAPLPGGRERAAPSVDEHHSISHRGTLLASARRAVTSARGGAVATPVPSLRPSWEDLHADVAPRSGP